MFLQNTIENRDIEKKTHEKVRRFFKYDFRSQASFGAFGHTWTINKQHVKSMSNLQGFVYNPCNF